MFFPWERGVRLLTSIPKYRKSSIGFISFGYFNWSGSLSWHRTLSFLAWPMLIDRHLCSMIHRFLQWLFMCGPMIKVIFAKTWPTKAKPLLGSWNLTRLQINENFKMSFRLALQRRHKPALATEALMQARLKLVLVNGSLLVETSRGHEDFQIIWLIKYFY